MDALDELVGFEQEIFTGLGAEDGAIVADAADSLHAAKTRDYLQLIHGTLFFEHKT
jgi:hypothetical protein